MILPRPHDALRVPILTLIAAMALICGGPVGIGAQSALPTPESVLGFKPGADFHLADYDQMLDYFRRLDAASDRLQVLEVGRSTHGLPMVVLLISSAENLRDLDRYREISLRLAHPGGLSDSEARRLATEGKAIVHVDGGMHSSEVAGAQHTIQLAYDLVTTEDDPEFRAIRENVIVMLWPTLNPDGQNWLPRWYAQNLGTEFETSGMPRLYQEYIGHDNNRDGYMLSVPESRYVTHTIRSWEPQILYNHHQTAPFPTRIWIPPFAEPVSPYVHPLMWRTVNMIGMAMAQALEERGQEGATHMGTGFDDWYPGFMDHAHNFHNTASFLTETGLYSLATPHFYFLRDFPQDKRELRPESLYSSPWKGGWWRLGDAVAYMHTASLSVIDFAAKYKWDVLYNRYQAGRDVIAHYTQDPPYAYFIPQQQRDPVAAVEMLRRLAFNGIEVHRLTRPVEVNGVRHPAGTWVIPMQQPFANFVHQLLSVQEYPDLREYPEGPPDQPYDVSGWTLPYQMDVKVYTAYEPLTEEALGSLEPVRGQAVDWRAEGAQGATFDAAPDVGFDIDAVAAGLIPLPGAVRGSGPALLLDPAQNNTFRALNAAWEAGGNVRYLPPAEGRGARYVVSGIPENTTRRLVDELALQAERGRVEGTEVRRPRLGVFEPWGGNIDVGWTRLLFDQFAFTYVHMRNADFLTGDLRERFDVIVLADLGTSSIVEGRTPGTIPARYAGGIGEQGVRELDRFVRGGGTLVCLNGSSRFAMEALHLPVTDVSRGLRSQDLFLAGTIVAVTADPSHPVMAGMESESELMVHRSPVFTVTDGFEGRALAKYQEAGSPLLSGYLIGEEHLHGFAAGLDVKHGQGHVLLLGFRPQWRGQPFGMFRILFNAALFHGGVAAGTAPGGEFWTPPPAGEGEETGARTEGSTQAGMRRPPPR